jgi:hypothetical protein
MSEQQSSADSADGSYLSDRVFEGVRSVDAEDAERLKASYVASRTSAEPIVREALAGVVELYEHHTSRSGENMYFSAEESERRWGLARAALTEPQTARQPIETAPKDDFEVETGMMRIDVCGKLQAMHFGEVMEIRDGDHQAHDPETFYTDFDAVSALTRPLRPDEPAISSHQRAQGE